MDKPKYVPPDPRTLLTFNLPRLISAYNEEHKTSQNEFAKRAGLTSSCLSNYMVGLRFPRPEHMQSICTVLGVPVAELFAEK